MNSAQKTARFEMLYVNNFAKLKRFAKQYVLSEEDAENIVQDVFGYIWEHWKKFESHPRLTAYLLVSVRNRSIDLLRRKTVSRSAEDKVRKNMDAELKLGLDSLESLNLDLPAENDLDKVVRTAIECLPDKCREIFLKSKIEGKKQKEIAEEMAISLNTVETQMGIAYQKLRTELKKILQ